MSPAESAGRSASKVDCLRLHLELSGSQYTRHLELAETLFSAHKNNTLNKTIENHQPELTADLTHTLIISGEDCLNKGGNLQVGLTLLEITHTLIQRFNYQELLPHWTLILSGYHLSSGENEKAAELITHLQQQNIDLPSEVRQGLRARCVGKDLEHHARAREAEEGPLPRHGTGGTVPQ